MKYFTVFSNHSEYETFRDGNNYVIPNISVCRNPREVHFNKKIQKPNEIWYTTTDENPVNPALTNAFLDSSGNSLNIISNKYE